MSASGHPSSVHLSALVFNGRFHQWHHNTHHRVPHLSGTGKKHVNHGDPYHTLDNSDLRATQNILIHINHQIIRLRVPGIYQYMPRLVHPYLIILGITAQIKGYRLDKGYKVVHGLKKKRTDKLESLIVNLNHMAHIIP